MSTPSRKKFRPSLASANRAEAAGIQALAAEPDHPFSVTPLLGALLRITHEALTIEILQALRRQGLEMTETEFGVMRYPGPDGVRPIDLARRCNMTKQAMNYVLSSFESRGFIERKSPAGQRSTTIYLTPKGWKLLSATRHCATEIEARWATHIGLRRFDAVRASLQEIAIWLGKLPASRENHVASHVDAFRLKVEAMPISSGSAETTSRLPKRRKREKA